MAMHLPVPANDNAAKVWRDYVEAISGFTWAEFQRIAPYLPRRREPTWEQLKAYIDRGGKYPLDPSDPWPFGWLR